MIHRILGWYMTSADLLQTKPKPVLSQVLAPADAAYWARIQDAVNGVTNLLDPQRPPHACTDVCRTYDGPILLGRRGETITPGRAS